MALLRPDDDLPHARGEGASWQENYLFMGLGDDHRAAFFVHVARLPALDACDVKLAVQLGDDVWSFTEHHSFGDGLDVAGFRFRVDEPFRAWHVHAEGGARAGRGPGLLVTTGRGDVPVSIDVSFTAAADPVIQSQGFEELDAIGSGSSGNHYIQGGRWRGTLRVGDQQVEGEGWCIRDHTWGERDIPTMELCWWTPMVFDDGTYQLAGIDMHTTDGARATFSYRRDGGEQVALPFLDVEVTEGDLSDYSRATIRCGDDIAVEATRVLRLPIAYYRGGGVGWVSDDALSTLRTADGRTGFGIIELNRLMTDEEIAALPASALT
jgi:hypothetical protein